VRSRINSRSIWARRFEETEELIAYLAAEIATRRLDEKFVRERLIRWEMASLLLGWNRFRRASP
jgi:hypothetical protein